MAKKIPINYCPQATADNESILKEIKTLIWGKKDKNNESTLERLETLGISVVSLADVCKYAKIEKDEQGVYNISQAQFEQAFDGMVKEGVALITEQDSAQMDILSFFPFTEKNVQDGEPIATNPTYPITYDENGNKINVSEKPELIEKYQDAYNTQLEILKQTVKAQGTSCIKNLPPRVAAAQKELIIQILRDTHQENVDETQKSIDETEASRQQTVKNFNEAKSKYDALKHEKVSQLTTEGQEQREELLNKYRLQMEEAKKDLDSLYATHKQNNKELKNALKEQKGLDKEIESAFGTKAIKKAEKSIEKNTEEKITFGQHINKWVQNQKDRNLRFKAEVKNEAIATQRPIVVSALNVFMHNPPLPIIGEPIKKLSEFFKNKEGEDKKENKIIASAKKAFSKLSEKILKKDEGKEPEEETTVNIIQSDQALATEGQGQGEEEQEYLAEVYKAPVEDQNAEANPTGTDKDYEDISSTSDGTKPETLKNGLYARGFKENPEYMCACFKEGTPFEEFDTTLMKEVENGTFTFADCVSYNYVMNDVENYLSPYEYFGLETGN